MRLTSIRARTLLAGVLTAAAIVVAVLVTAYVVVANGMGDEASQETSRLADRAAAEVRHAVVTALLDARRAGLSGRDEVAAAEGTFSNAIPERFGVAPGFLEGHFAFWDPDVGEPQYASDRSAIVDDPAGRARAIADSESVATHLGGHPVILNIVRTPDLGVYVVHIPFQRPDGRTWILDVVYVPAREAQAIELIRPPMLALSALAIVGTALIMLLSTNWILRLLSDLRTAADSIDADLLDVRLPDEGSNEVGDLVRSLNALIGRLQRRAEAQTRFVANASHELATPVAGIRGYVGILRSWGADEPEVREEALAAIDSESRRMARLTSQLLAVIRGEHELEFHSSRCNINAVCAKVLGGAAARYAEKDLVLVGPGTGSLILYGDPDRMEDVIAILVDNAAKYTPERGTVTVSTARRKGDVVIEVVDTGRGIPPEDLPNIFERFYRSAESRSKHTGGFGLGLAIAKEIVGGAGGLIDVTSEVGIGTTFTVRVPRGRE